MDQTQIVDKIMSEIRSYAEKHGNEVNPRVPEEIQRSAKSFKSLIDHCGYRMDVHVDDEGSCVVRFSNDEGQVFTTYTFCNVLKVGVRN